MGGLYYGNDHHAPILKVSNTENHELNLGFFVLSRKILVKEGSSLYPQPLGFVGWA